MPGWHVHTMINVWTRYGEPRLYDNDLTDLITKKLHIVKSRHQKSNTYISSSAIIVTGKTEIKHIHFKFHHSVSNILLLSLFLLRKTVVDIILLALIPKCSIYTAGFPPCGRYIKAFSLLCHGTYRTEHKALTSPLLPSNYEDFNTASTRGYHSINHICNSQAFSKKIGRMSCCESLISCVIYIHSCT
jgi:hypothetical protein